MKKVLILSYFFPPCNLTASNRIASWQKHLPENDIYPIVITRNWTGNELNDYQRLESSGATEKHIQNQNSEVYFIPYKSSLRDKVFIKGQKSLFYSILSKILTLLYLFLQNVSIRFIPYNNLYFKTKEILQNDKEINTLIISANPFEQFFFGYLLKKEFPNINWIADYRDDWTTNELKENKSFLTKVLNIYNQYFEKKWIRSASSIVSVSEVYVARLQQFHNKEAHLIMNGYNEKITSIYATNKTDNFTIAYSGTIYSKQDFTMFFEAVFELCSQFTNNNFEVLFIGSQESLPLGFLDKFIATKPSNLEFKLTPRISWEENIAFLKASDLLFLSSYGNIKGIPTSKLYDYIACEKPILLCPSDEDVMKKIITQTNTGSACTTTNQALDFMQNIFEGKNKPIPNKKETEKYATKNQVKVLAELLK